MNGYRQLTRHSVDTVIVDSLAAALARINCQAEITTLSDERYSSCTTSDTSYLSDSTSNFGEWNSSSSDRCSPRSENSCYSNPSVTFNIGFWDSNSGQKSRRENVFFDRVPQVSFACNEAFNYNTRFSNAAHRVEDDASFFLRPRQLPPSTYQCHICYKHGHYIKDCPKALSNSSETPYQGPKQCFGMFKCPKCKRKWTSGNSFANMEQDCKKCKISTFPFKQMKLDYAIEQGLYKPRSNAKVSNGFQSSL